MAVEGWKCLLLAAVTLQLAVAAVQKVRLADGDAESEGRVEVYDSDRWFTLCGNDWTIPAARTVCRELGFGDVKFPKSTYAMRTSFFGKGGQTIYPRGFACWADSTSLSECRETRVRCGLGDDVASVFCKDRVRLSGGAVPHQGRLEVLRDGVWTTVCGRSWGDPEAQVACRQLGFPGAVDWRWSVEYFPRAPEGVPTPQYVLACNGSERSLLNCNRLQVGDCSHSEDVGLLCEAGVRLAGGTTQSEGRVEVYHKGRWGAVCDRDWAANKEGAVVCKELGFHGNAENIPSDHDDDLPKRPVWINGTRCTGSEDRLRRVQQGNLVPRVVQHNANSRYQSTVGRGSCALNAIGRFDSGDHGLRGHHCRVVGDSRGPACRPPEERRHNRVVQTASLQPGGTCDVTSANLRLQAGRGAIRARPGATESVLRRGHLRHSRQNQEKGASSAIHAT
ncbi:PRSS12 [Branchiostoma lanceolatum]|uniref:PRSS12 protein n=1 Tax=Branchiostoma lanceolatum TaxID=7740 RepID=A0A8K0EC37_BRALA|nr:PRSS12 [Branchiostoma lanceolatum]